MADAVSFLQNQSTASELVCRPQQKDASSEQSPFVTGAPRFGEDLRHGLQSAAGTQPTSGDGHPAPQSHPATDGHGTPAAGAHGDDHHGHSPVETAQHLTHQAKVGVHAVHEGAEALHPSVHGLAESKTAGEVVGEGAPKPAAKAAEAMGQTPLTHGQAHQLEQATATLENYSGLQKTAEGASKSQSQAAKNLNNALTKGATPEEIQGLRDTLAKTTTESNKAHQALLKAEEEAKAARKALQTLKGEVGSAKQTGPLWQRAAAALTETETGAKIVQGAKTLAESRVGSAVNALAHSKILKWGGRALVVGAAGLDAAMAIRPGSTVAGNATRATAQGAASLAMYTQPALLPVLAAEAFIMDKPHVTGTVQSAVQTAGVVADYVTGGSEKGDQALSNLDSEMKDGKYGAVIKGANYFGQGLADNGVSGTAKQTADYWSQASPGSVWRDVKDIYSWLTE